MFNLLYNISGIAMLIWYSCLRWTFLPSTLFNSATNFTDVSSTTVTTLGWVYAPINLFTAFSSFIFLIPALFIIDDMQNKFWLCGAIFLLFRNIYYSLEDIIDLYNHPSKTQLSYVIIDLMMVLFTSLWLIRYYGVIKC